MRAFGTYANIILELNASRRVKLDFLQRLAHNIVGLIFTLLGCLDSGSFIKVSSVVDIKPLKGIGQAEDFVLLELRKLPIKS